ncbi:MAG: YhcH/YjgK/YiaL family protein [Sphaerochaeta sp.]
MIYDQIEHMKNYIPLIHELADVIPFIESLDLVNIKEDSYKISPGIIANIFSLNTQNDKTIYEIHKSHVDIQIGLIGKESINYGSVFKSIEQYDEENDGQNGNCKLLSKSILKPGYFMIFFPNEPHCPGITINEIKFVKKCVIKIEDRK